jgi:acetyl esterase/lipase
VSRFHGNLPGNFHGNFHGNLVFRELLGFRPLMLDLHLPEPGPGGGPWPVVMRLHGGGWRSGSRLRLPEPVQPFGFHKRMLAHGLAVADVDYRLSGEARFPAQLDDVLAAAGWLREHAASFGLDPARPAVLGESAGGLLAALAGLHDSSFKAVVLWYPPVDLLDLRPEQPGSSEQMLLGDQPSAVPQLARQASPIHHVHAGAPPFLCVHGDADQIVPLSQSERLAAALTGAGVRCELLVVPGAGHTFTGAEDIAALVEASAQFIAREVNR